MHERYSRTRIFSSRIAASFSIALMLTVAGCRNAPVAAPQSDAVLTQAVQVKLGSDTSLGGEPIQASVQQGVATLSGHVSSDAARSLAANDTAQIAGIRTVINNLVVQASAVVPPSTAAAVTSPPPPPRIKPAKPVLHARAIAKDSAQPAPPALVQESQNIEAPAPIEREQPESPAPRPQAPLVPSIRSITLDSGTTLPIRITQTLDSASTQEGETFSGVLASDVLADGLVVLPQGTPASGRVVAVQEAAHFKGNSLLTLELTSLDRKGDHLPITTDSFSKAGSGRGKNSAEKIGGGAAVGAILGGIFGGGKGAAIGAAAGGGAGAGVQAVTKGQQVQIESETLVRFHLSGPVTIRVANGNRSGDIPSGTQNDPIPQRHL